MKNLGEYIIESVYAVVDKKLEAACMIAAGKERSKAANQISKTVFEDVKQRIKFIKDGCVLIRSENEKNEGEKIYNDTLKVKYPEIIELIKKEKFETDSDIYDFDEKYMSEYRKFLPYGVAGYMKYAIDYIQAYV